MAILVCSNCQAENAEGARFCDKCGKRVADFLIDPELEGRLLERIEAKLKDNWLSKEVVEKDIAINAATRLSDWAKLFAIGLAVPLAIIAAILAFFGVKSTSDLAKVEEQAAKLTRTANDLASQYKPLREELPELTRIATTLHGLEDRVQNVEAEVARFAPSTPLSSSTKAQLNLALKNYADHLAHLGLMARSIPTIHIQDPLPEAGFHSYLRGNNMFALPEYARPANILREYSHGVLSATFEGDENEQGEYSAIEAGVASYLTADFLKSPIVDAVNLDRRMPFSGTPKTWQQGQDEGPSTWGSFLWALRKQFGSERTDFAIVRAWGTVRPTSPPQDYRTIFIRGLVSTGLDSLTIDALLKP